MHHFAKCKKLSDCVYVQHPTTVVQLHFKMLPFPRIQLGRLESIFLIFCDQLNLWLTKPLNVFSCLVDFISVSFLAAISWTNFIASSLSQLFTSNSTIISHLEDLTSQRWRRAKPLAPYKEGHCQRHKGPKDWVLLTKVTSLGYITSSYTNLLNQTSAFRPDLASESRPKLDFITSTKHQQQNIDQTSVSDQIKSPLNLNFKILTTPCAQSLNKI